MAPDARSRMDIKGRRLRRRETVGAALIANQECRCHTRVPSSTVSSRVCVDVVVTKLVSAAAVA